MHMHTVLFSEELKLCTCIVVFSDEQKSYLLIQMCMCIVLCQELEKWLYYDCWNIQGNTQPRISKNKNNRCNNKNLIGRCEGSLK